MIAIPSSATPICVPLAGRPNPCATSSPCTLRTALLASMGRRCCAFISVAVVQLPDLYLPHSSCLELNWRTRQNGSWQNFTLLTAVHNTSWNRRETTRSVSMCCDLLWLAMRLRGSLIDLCVPHWLVVRDLGVLRIGGVLHSRLAGAVQRLRFVLRLNERCSSGALAVVAHACWCSAGANWDRSPQQPAGNRGP